MQKGVVFTRRVLGAQRRAWLIILGNDRFPIFIFKRIIYRGNRKRKGQGRDALGLLDNFFERGRQEGWQPRFFFFPVAREAAFSGGGSLGEKRPFHRSLRLDSPSLDSFNPKTYTSLPRTYLEK